MQIITKFVGKLKVHSNETPFPGTLDSLGF